MLPFFLTLRHLPAFRYLSFMVNLRGLLKGIFLEVNFDILWIIRWMTEDPWFQESIERLLVDQFYP